MIGPLHNSALFSSGLQPVSQSSGRINVSYNQSQTQLAHVAVEQENGSKHQVTAFQSSQSSVSLVYQKPAAQAAAPVASATEPAPQNNPYASNILGFITGQLKLDVSEGATVEELQSRLEAGLSGFLEGYGHAAEELGALSPEIEAQLTETYNQVLKGIAGLAEELGIENPVSDDMYKAEPEISASTASPAVAGVSAGPVSTSADALAGLKKTVLAEALSESKELKILDSLRQMKEAGETYEKLGKAAKARFGADLSASVGQSKSFSFDLTTADGDRVTINASAMKVGASQYAQNGNGAYLSLAGSQSAEFGFSVEGELDEDELKAINDLLTQVNAISESFFEGDIASAFEQALSVDFDGAEISGFDLNLKMVTVERMEQSSSGNAETSGSLMPVGQDRRSGILESFLGQVEKAAQMAESMGQSRTLVADMLDALNRNLYANRPNAEHVAPLVEQVL